MSFLDEKFTKKYDDHPKLKGGQKKLPDALQKDIIGTSNNEEEVEEGKLSKVLGGAAVLATLLGLNKAASEKIYKGDPKIKSLTTQYEKAKEDGDKKAMAKFEKEIKNRKTQIDTGKMDEAKKTVELPADTTFTLDLKHLMKKHLDEGKSQEDVVKLTKKLMAKLHNNG